MIIADGCSAFRLVLAEKWRAGWTLEKKFHASVARADLDGRAVILCRPQTFMNESGQAVGPLAAFYRVAPAGLLVTTRQVIRILPAGPSSQTSDSALVVEFSPPGA